MMRNENGPVSAEGAAKLVGTLIGQRVRNPRIGVGSFLTLDLGEAAKGGDSGRSPWHLWAYLCSWRIEKSDVVVAGSSDDRDLMTRGAALLSDRAVEEVQVTRWQDLHLHLSDAVMLRLLVTGAGVGDQWMLWTPSTGVLTAAGGGHWVTEPSRFGDPKI